MVAYAINAYGVHNWLADVDRDRQYWRDGDHLVSYILDWASNEGFCELQLPKLEEFDSAAHFRQRYQIGRI